MWPRWLRPRFSIRALLLLVAVVAILLWWFYTLPVYMPDHQDRLARAAIDPYELSMAGNGDAAHAPPELVAILGDSRLKHWRGVGSVSFVNKETLLSHGGDETIRFWNTKNGQQLRNFPTRICALAPETASLFLVGENRRNAIEIWDAAAWKLRERLDLKPGSTCIGILACGNGSRIAAAIGNDTQDCEIQVWDVAKRTMLCEFKHQKWERYANRLDDAGQRLALYDGDLVHVYDVATGKSLGKAGPFVHVDSKAVLYHCLFVPESPSEVITADAGGQVVIWNYGTGEKVVNLHNTRGSTRVLNFDTRGKTLSVGSGPNLWQYRLIGREWRLSEEVAPDAASRSGINDVSPGLETTAFACNDAIVLHPTPLALRNRFHITSLAFDPLGRYLATSDNSGEISLWTMKTWQSVRKWPADAQQLLQLAFTPDGSSLITLGNTRMAIWDPDAAAERAAIETGFDPRQFAISPDGQFLAAPAYVRDSPAPYAIRLWKLADGSVHQTIADKSAANRGQLAFAAGGSTLVMGGGKGMTVWDLAHSKLIADLGSKTIHDVPLAVHPDGKRVAMQPWYGPVEVWDITTQKLLVSARPHAAKALVNSIAIHPNGKWAASSADEGTVYLWDFDTGAVIASWQLGPPKGVVFQVAFSPDGRYLATVNGNGTAYILRLDGIAGFTSR